MAGHKGPLRIAIEDFLETGPLGNIIRGGVSQWIHDYEQELIIVNDEIIDLILQIPELPTELRTVLLRARSGEHQAGAVTVGAVAVGAVVAIVLGMMGPVSRSGEHLLERAIRSNRFTLEQAILANWRVPGWTDHPYRDMADMGYRERNIQAYEEVLRPRIAESDLLRLWHRHGNMKSYVESELTKRGWLASDIPHLVSASTIYPGLSDIARMAVREVFDPNQRSILSLDSEYPPEFGKRAAELGVDERFAQDFWAAHWELPSLTMGFEMLHRLRPGRSSNPVTIGDIDNLIKALDYSPVWRARLREISYTPLTRVDIRRIYQLGQMSRQDVYDAYLDLGYNERNAQLLTDFATLGGETAGKDLTRSAIENAYIKGLVPRDFAIAELIDLGYSEEEATLLLAIKEYDREEKLEKQEIEVIQLRYDVGEIDDTTAIAQLSSLGLPLTYVNNLLEEWRIRKAKKIKLPTKSELEQLYENDIISFDEMSDQMKRRGYTPQVAEWLIALIDVKVSETRAKELERAQKEQERLEKAELKTEYQLDRANYDVTIAEWKSYIADLKLALHDLEDSEQIAMVKEEIDRVKTYIAQLTVAKAELKADFLGGTETSEV